MDWRPDFLPGSVEERMAEENFSIRLLRYPQPKRWRRATSAQRVWQESSVFDFRVQDDEARMER